ncbi:hypothetical protein SISSUDRAFT_987200 [Sistotremastrum suecicum HHB10207 ss-3]|uniref:Restriction of telomere capping protein 4 n=1 Tax=Sistotremastrum suecicum HHB10207 ss-3 TaxID=1314776 RepID=A0A166CS36_9AGAM|nr:hypothetical protein SISSUDRAFT_987200 [Sistotremastrum suecicum HHB10207 ss-3]
MPEQPSAHLLHLIKLARKRARPDPRHTNSLGLRAPITSYVDVCTRHEFEKVQVPRAQAKGWPAHIDFDGLPARVQTLKSDLDRISLNPSSSSFYSELKSDIDKKGKASVTSAGAQFALFERSQPGYYGERGSSIIHHCLLATYPPSSFDLDIIFPLTSTEFTQNVLLPETATRLIMDDMDADYEDAIKTLRASGKYGVTMFPSLEVDDVVDKILASDTRERLFNQEDEDWVDPDAKEAKRQKTEEKVKGKGKAKAKSNRMDTSSPPPMSDDRPRPVPRPRPVQRGKPATEMKSTPLAAVSETDSEDSSSDSELELPAAMRMQKPTAIVPAVAPKLKYMDIDWD